MGIFNLRLIPALGIMVSVGLRRSWLGFRCEVLGGNGPRCKRIILSQFWESVGSSKTLCEVRLISRGGSVLL
jgi:hypothetical protein